MNQPSNPPPAQAETSTALSGTYNPKSIDGIKSTINSTTRSPRDATRSNAYSKQSMNSSLPIPGTNFKRGARSESYAKRGRKHYDSNGSWKDGRL